MPHICTKSSLDKLLLNGVNKVIMTQVFNISSLKS